MEMPSLTGLEGLTDIGLRGGVDMRPTLLRVLTDLYVQKLTHTDEEDRHYTELALRLLDSVDVATRAAVASECPRQFLPKHSYHRGRESEHGLCADSNVRRYPPICVDQHCGRCPPGAEGRRSGESPVE